MIADNTQAQPALLNEKKTAESLGVARNTLRKWRETEGLPFIRAGRRIFYRRDAVEEWLRRKEAQAASGVKAS